MPALPIRFDAVLFDFDGTLVDTMPIHYEAYRRVLADAGIELSEDDFYDNIGGPGPEAIPRFLRGRPVALTTREIHGRKKELLLRLLDEVELPMLPTAGLLPLLHGRAPLALATSGARLGIEKMLRRLGWQDYFAAVVSGEDVERGKPAPDVFLAAAARLGVRPESCIVFEDTDDGVAAGLAAGALTLDVRCMAAPSARRPSRRELAPGAQYKA